MITLLAYVFAIVFLFEGARILFSSETFSSPFNLYANLILAILMWFGALWLFNYAMAF